LRDAQNAEEDSIELLNAAIDSLAPAELPGAAREVLTRNTLGAAAGSSGD
jgi:hypothetical protein